MLSAYQSLVPPLPQTPAAPTPAKSTGQLWVDSANSLVKTAGSPAKTPAKPLAAPLATKRPEDVSRNLLAAMQLNTSNSERDEAFRDKLLRFVAEKTSYVDEAEKHLRDLNNKVAQAQATLDTLRGTARFLDQRYLEATNQQLQQLLVEYLNKVSS